MDFSVQSLMIAGLALHTQQNIVLFKRLQASNTVLWRGRRSKLNKKNSDMARKYAVHPLASYC
jgi:hypothetical protein